MSNLRLSTLSLTIVLFTLGALILPVNTTLADHCKGKHKDYMGCDGGGGGGDSGGGGKALRFEIDVNDVFKCDATPVSEDASFGQVTWAGNVLWDPKNIHIHFKLQLKDVDPGTYDILGNNGIECVDYVGDYAICESDEVDDCVPESITVKESRRQGRTSGALRLPGCDTNIPTTVWVTVTVDNGNTTRILRSTPVTIVLPPNEVGTGNSCQ